MKISVKNESNNTIVLDEAHGYAVTEVTGLSPATAQINTTKTAGDDGSLFNSAMIAQRNIVITVYMLPDVEAHRRMLYAYLAPKRRVTLYFESGGRKTHISGRVESFEGTFYTSAEVFSISIICTEPYFLDDTAKTKSVTTGDTSLANSGDTAVGFELSLTATGTSASLEIETANGSLTIAKTLTANDTITICTKRGSFQVLVNGSNVINLITIEDDIPQIAPGGDTLTITGAVSGTITYTEAYMGM